VKSAGGAAAMMRVGMKRSAEQASFDSGPPPAKSYNGSGASFQEAGHTFLAPPPHKKMSVESPLHTGGLGHPGNVNSMYCLFGHPSNVNSINCLLGHPGNVNSMNCLLGHLVMSTQ